MTDSGWLAPRSLCHLSLQMRCYGQSAGHFGFYTQKIHSRILFCSKQAHMVYLVLQMWRRHRQEFFRLGISNLCPFLINHRLLEHSWWPLFLQDPKSWYWPHGPSHPQIFVLFTWDQQRGDLRFLNGNSASRGQRLIIFSTEGEWYKKVYF